MVDPGAVDSTASDPFNLARFVEAQSTDFDIAVTEIRAGRKRSHWMWYIFPQIDGLGFSDMSRRYSIRSEAEAMAFFAHPVLGPRLVDCCEALLSVVDKSANDIFGSPDDMKLHSSATLFALASSTGSIFDRVLDRYFAGERDPAGVRILSAWNESSD